MSRFEGAESFTKQATDAGRVLSTDEARKMVDSYREAYPKTKDFYALRRIRHGKTTKDRANGAHANRLKNRQARDEWCNNRNAKASQHPSGNR